MKKPKNMHKAFFEYIDHHKKSYEAKNLDFSDAFYFFPRFKLLPKSVYYKSNEYRNDATQAYFYIGFGDVVHVSPDWIDIINLGFFGIYERIRKFRKNCQDGERADFYDGLCDLYSATEKFMLAIADEALSRGNKKMASSLINLTKRPPATLYEALQLIMLYYNITDEKPTRTLGRLDSMLLPFAEGLDDEEVLELLTRFMAEVNAYRHGADIPFAIGGCRGFNRLSYLLLRAYGTGVYPYVKIHILCTDNTPKDVLTMAFELIRSGKNSIVFMSDEVVTKGLLHIGAEPEDAREYQVVGCYECGARQEKTASCSARINLVKALELALLGGKDMLTGLQIGKKTKIPETMEELTEALGEQIVFGASEAMALSHVDEAEFGSSYAAPHISATYLSCMERGRDMFSGYGAKYCNSSINAQGIGTMADSLYAIEKLVFIDKQISLPDLVKILACNWAGEEKLRQTVKNKFAKYGCNNPAVDKYAKWATDLLDKTVSGKPNATGGVWRLGLFSIDWRWRMGQTCGASADGRLAGEPLSQNSGASFGADKNGIGAHLLSVASLGADRTPNGTIADIDIHASQTRGDAGMTLLISTLLTYFEHGGMAVHYNVLDTEALTGAKAHPERYPNLQVRVCGWNALFVDLSDAEQDEFIERSKR